MLELHPPAALCRIVGERVRTLRLQRNLSQQELARMCGVSLSGIRRFEAQGQGSVLLLAQVAVALQAVDTLDALLVMPMQSIADVTRAAQLNQRQRASRTRLKAQP